MRNLSFPLIALLLMIPVAQAEDVYHTPNIASGYFRHLKYFSERNEVPKDGDMSVVANSRSRYFFSANHELVQMNIDKILEAAESAHFFVQKIMVEGRLGNHYRIATFFEFPERTDFGNRVRIEFYTADPLMAEIVEDDLDSYRTPDEEQAKWGRGQKVDYSRWEQTNFDDNPDFEDLIAGMLSLAGNPSSSSVELSCRFDATAEDKQHFRSDRFVKGTEANYLRMLLKPYESGDWDHSEGTAFDYYQKRLAYLTK